MSKKDKVDFDYGKLRLDIDRYINKVLSTAAGAIRDDLTETAMYSIARFYMDYSPKYYERHYYNFMDHSYRKYYSNPHNKIFRGGVEFTPEEIDDVYGSKKYPESPAQVFDFVYAGFHGPASIYNGIKTMSPSPMELITRRRDEIANNELDKFIDIGREKARSQTYNYLRFGKR